MGCAYFNNKKIKIRSMSSFKRETKKNLKIKKDEDSKNQISSFADFQYDGNSNSSYSSSEKQSEILFNGIVEKNELIFV